jgi:hypothetical protein
MTEKEKREFDKLIGDTVKDLAKDVVAGGIDIDPRDLDALAMHFPKSNNYYDYYNEWK